MLDFSNASASGRFVLWSECLAVWKDHWLLGIGLGPENFSAAYAPYATGLLDFQPPHSNMLYLEMFLSTGIVGGLLFCGFFFGIFVRLRRAVRARPEKRDRREAQALIAALAGAALGGIPEYAGVTDALLNWADAGKTLVMTTQCPYEGADLNVYEVGRAFCNRPGVLMGGAATTEALLAKTMWALAQAERPDGTIDREKLMALFASC